VALPRTADEVIRGCTAGALRPGRRDFIGSRTIVRILYVFPHPDDESFGPALAIAGQVRAGHEVHLLTLTRGGATKVRHALGHSVEEMGRVREREMRRMAEVLRLASLTVLDMPDGGLKGMDPREIERAVESHVRRVEPHVLVTYAVKGVSGFPDHLVSHAVVKRVYCALRDEDGLAVPRRLALFTVAESQNPGAGPIPLHASPWADIGAEVRASAEDVETAQRALACYETYAETIRQHDPLGRLDGRAYFELFGEAHDPPLADLTDGLD
jgi:N-acetylglucosamine malate deacetylase 2